MRNTALQDICRLAECDPAAAADRLAEKVRAAAGPLRQPLAPQEYLLTFVLLDRREQPALRTELLPGLEPSAALDPVPGIEGAWYFELTARHDIRTTYQFQERVLEFPGAQALDDGAVMQQYLRDRYRVSFADPANPDRRPPVVPDPDVEPPNDARSPNDTTHDGSAALVDPDAIARSMPAEKWDSLLELPQAPQFPWHGDVDVRGTVAHRQFESTLLGNSRRITIWTPPGYRDDGPELPVVLLIDGEAFATEPVLAPLVFDALLADDRVRPFVGVLVHNATDTSRMTEYPCNTNFAAAIADELLPELRTHYRISTRAADVVAGGFSYGGLAVDYLALFRPDSVGAALSLSASVWWGKRRQGTGEFIASSGRDEYPEWLTRNIPAAPVEHPVPRFWLDVGLLEDAPIPFADGVTMLETNRRFAEALRANGYPVLDYVEFPGGHDQLHWRAALAQGLGALLGR